MYTPLGGRFHCGTCATDLLNLHAIADIGGRGNAAAPLSQGPTKKKKMYTSGSVSEVVAEGDACFGTGESVTFGLSSHTSWRKRVSLATLSEDGVQRA